MTINELIYNELLKDSDEKYAEFQARLIPNIERISIIGVRTPIIIKLSRIYAKRDDVHEFLDALPHKYHEENLLHSFIISQSKDFDYTINQVNKFLSYVNNWAICDQLSPAVFKYNQTKLINYISTWISSDEPFVIRFGISMLMKHFLDEEFKPSYLIDVANIESDEYYVNMMRAWYFAEALYKQYESAIVVFENKMIDDWTWKKAIQKAIESRKISDTTKEKLRNLRKNRQNYYMLSQFDN